MKNQYTSAPPFLLPSSNYLTTWLNCASHIGLHIHRYTVVDRVDRVGRFDPIRCTAREVRVLQTIPDSTESEYKGHPDARS